MLLYSGSGRLGEGCQCYLALNYNALLHSVCHAWHHIGEGRTCLTIAVLLGDDDKTAAVSASEQTAAGRQGSKQKLTKAVDNSTQPEGCQTAVVDRKAAAAGVARLLGEIIRFKIQLTPPQLTFKDRSYETDTLPL